MTKELEKELAYFRQVLAKREPGPDDPLYMEEAQPLSDWGCRAVCQSVMHEPRGIELLIEQIRKEPVNERIVHFVYVTMLGVHNARRCGESRSVAELRPLVLRQICEEAERQALPPHFLTAFKLAWQEYTHYDH